MEQLLVLTIMQILNEISVNFYLLDICFVSQIFSVPLCQLILPVLDFRFIRQLSKCGRELEKKSLLAPMN